jgi:hypothetical protein
MTREQNAVDFLAHKGDLARLIARFDWSMTPLGCPGT